MTKTETRKQIIEDLDALHAIMQDAWDLIAEVRTLTAEDQAAERIAAKACHMIPVVRVGKGVPNDVPDKA